VKFQVQLYYLIKPIYCYAGFFVFIFVCHQNDLIINYCYSVEITFHIRMADCEGSVVFDLYVV